MNRVVDVVLGAIRAQICGQQYHIEHDLSDEILREVYTFAKTHDVVHIVAAELISQRAINNQELKELFKRQQIMAVYRYERINQELTEICRVLDEMDILYIPLKGSVLRQYYPEPWMRTSADIDILVPQGDVNTAADALVRELHYRSDGINEHDIQMFAPNGVHLELHFETIEDYFLPNANKVLQDIWAKHTFCIQGQQCAMSNEMFYFYHIAHMAKHFMCGGCGIRFFLDMWLLNHNIALEYDQEKRLELLKAGKLLDFAENAERLSEVWFGERSHTEITERMERYILNGGTYGSSENTIAVISVSKGGRLGYAKHLLFRPLLELKRQYRILYKHKWLYPFCQVHRWLCLPFNGGIARAKQSLNRGTKVYEKNGDNVEQILKVLKLINKRK